LAEKLGVQFFDKTLIMALEEKYHLTAEEIEKLKGHKQHWWEDFKQITFNNDHYAPQLYQMKIGLSEKVSSYELFEEEEKILNDLAEQESCVVAGRTGFYMLRNHPNHMSILIQASMPFRVERVMRKQHMSKAEACETIEKIDKMREIYVKQFTKTSRYDTRNYDLVISADGKTEDEIVDIIMMFIG